MAVIKNYADEADGVETAIEGMVFSAAMSEYFVSRVEQWKSFGKMNSHLYRAMLFKAMDQAKLNMEQKMLVFAFASIIKSQPRIIQAMEDTPESERFGGEGTWFAVRNFFDTKCTQYVSASKKNKKFPVVNLPGTIPGLDIFWWCVTTENSERTLANLKNRPTFTQINLQADVQTLAKEGYEFFWTKVVKGTRNEDKVDAPAMREEFYNTSAADEYDLISWNKSGQLIEQSPALADKGYSREEVETYLRTFDKLYNKSEKARGSPGRTSPPTASGSRSTAGSTT